MNYLEFGPSTIIGLALITVGLISYALTRESRVSRGVISNVL